MATGAERLTLEGHAGWVQQLLFAERGQTLISASNDTTALVWDLAPALAPAERPAPTDDQVAGWWADLAGADAVRGYAAVWRLTECPRAAVGLLRRHLRPVPTWTRF